MSNKLQFVAASQQRSSDRRKQQTKVCWTPENLVYAVLAFAKRKGCRNHGWIARLLYGIKIFLASVGAIFDNRLSFVQNSSQP